MKPETKEQLKKIWKYKRGLIKLFVIAVFLCISAYFLINGFSLLRGSGDHLNWLDGVTFGSSFCSYNNGEYNCTHTNYPGGKFYNEEISDLATYDYYLILGYVGMLYGIIGLLSGVISLLIAILLYYIWAGHE
jgi:hypothetical protein